MNKEDKPILLIFEGVDKVGKTTIKDEFNKATDFSYVVLDRLTTSSKVYNEVFNRDRLDYYESFEAKIINSFDVILVLLECSNESIKNRLINAKEELPIELSDIDKIKAMFRRNVINSGFDYIVLNTDLMSVDKCVEKIIYAVKLKERKK